MAPWNTDEPDIDEMLTPASYGETILDTQLLLYGMKYIPLKEFTPLVDLESCRDEYRETLLYILKIFGPDYFHNFMLEYKCKWMKSLNYINIIKSWLISNQNWIS